MNINMETNGIITEQQQQQQQALPQAQEIKPSRWEIELEFVQSLANSQYLNYLAQNNYLKDPNFLEYLKYLNYWREPRFAKYLVYPNCLHILTLLQNAEFRDQILRQDIVGVMMNDMDKRWREDDVIKEEPVPEIPDPVVAEQAGAEVKAEAGAEAGAEADIKPSVDVQAPVKKE